MLLTNIRCDGCGRKPNLLEWARGELTTAGYQDWRHPGIVFKDAGYPITTPNRAACSQLFYALFQRQLPDELSYLCPQCQAWAEAELPTLIRQLGAYPAERTIVDAHYFGDNY
jgi:hypothetical protein